MIEIVNDYNQIKVYIINNLNDYNDSTRKLLISYVNNLEDNKELKVIIDKEDSINGLLAYNPNNYQISLYAGKIDELLNYLVLEARKNRILQIKVNTIHNQLFLDHGFIVENETDILDMHYYNMVLNVTNPLLNKEVEVIVDKPFGSFHSFYPDEIYSCNGGYVLINDDYYEAYIYGVDEIVDKYKAKVIAIIYHEDDNEYLIVSNDENYDKQDVINTIAFEQQHYNIIIEWSK